MELPIKRNQEAIIQNFCRLRGVLCEEVLGEGQKYKSLRRNILQLVC